jgi:RNA polymerase sigma-70 factor (ECF subfamily)
MDTDLVVRAQNGDQGAFASLTEAIDERFHGVAFGILRDMSLAQDAVQSALLAVWRDLPRLRDPVAFEAWSYRLLVRACYGESRRSRRWLPNLVGAIADEPSVEGGISVVVDRDQLERGFRRLSVDQRAVVVLHHYLDLPLDRVAETLGIPEGTARSRLHRAVGALRAALEADARGTRETAPPITRKVAR